jgi:tricorn protease-like protein
MISKLDCNFYTFYYKFRWSCLTGECVRIMISVAGTVRSLKFSKQGNHLLSGNDYGDIVVFDIVKGTPLEVI